MNEQHHPTLRRLDLWTRGQLDDRPAEDVAAHVTDCLVCAMRTERAGDPISIPALDPDKPPPPVSVPAALRRAVTTPRNPDPAPGQLWRLAWAQVVTLALVVEPWQRGREVGVAPVAEDPHLADDATVQLNPKDSLFGLPLAVWLGLERRVPAFVLHAHLGEVDSFEAVATARGALAMGRRPAVPTGPPIDAPFDERAQYRRLLDETLGALSEANWVPSVPRRDAGALHRLLEGVPTDRVSAALGLEIDEVHELLTVGRLLGDEEVQALAELTGVSADEARTAAAPEIDPALVVAIDRPRRRPTFANRAARASRSEAEERRAILAQALPVAARRAGPRDAALDWDSVLDDLLAE